MQKLSQAAIDDEQSQTLDIACQGAASTYQFAHQGEDEIRVTFQELSKLYDPHTAKREASSVITDAEREPGSSNISPK